MDGVLAVDDATNELAYKLLGCSILSITRPWWSVRLDDDSWIAECHWKTDLYHGRQRLTDWSFDLVANGLIERVREVWLFCPPGHHAPLGSTACLSITEPGTAFQLKVGLFFSNIAAGYQTTRAHLIGRINNKVTGDCTILVYDNELQSLFEWKEQNIYQGLGTWLPGSLAPIGNVSNDVLGLKV